MFSTMLVAYDGSEQSWMAVRAAAEMAHKFNSQVIALQVFEVSTAPLPGYSVSEDAQGVTRSFVDQLQTALEKEAAVIFDKASIRYELVREIGHPVGRIVAVAEREQADLILMGSRGMGGLKSLLLGSVSDGVLHHAHCPVLIMR